VRRRGAASHPCGGVPDRRQRVSASNTGTIPDVSDRRTVYEVQYEPPPVGFGEPPAVLGRTAQYADAVQLVLFHHHDVGITHLPTPIFSEVESGCWVGPVPGGGEYRIRRTIGAAGG
jgi:hypothetical protein